MESGESSVVAHTIYVLVMSYESVQQCATHDKISDMSYVSTTLSRLYRDGTVRLVDLYSHITRGCVQIPFVYFRRGRVGRVARFVLYVPVTRWTSIIVLKEHPGCVAAKGREFGTLHRTVDSRVRLNEFEPCTPR